MLILLSYRCGLRKCRSLPPPLNGKIECLRQGSNAYPMSPAEQTITASKEKNNITHDRPPYVNTLCRFSCNEGHRLAGSSARACLPIALWTGIQAACKREYFILLFYIHENLHSNQSTKSTCYSCTQYH